MSGNCGGGPSGIPLHNREAKGGIVMAEKVKSKTDVSARAENKGRAQLCRLCGKKVDVVVAVSSTGKKRMRRLCCES